MAEQSVTRQQPAAADAEFRITGLGGGAFDEFDARPYAAGILPAAARTAEPLAENGAGGDDAAFGFFHRASE